MANKYIDAGRESGGTIGGYGEDAGHTGGAAFDAFPSGFVVNGSYDNPPPVSALEKARVGDSVYLFTGFDANSSQKVRMFFAEYNSFVYGPGLRLFHIDINGTRAATDVDVYALAGTRGLGIVLEFIVNANGAGVIEVDFIPSAMDPFVNAFSIESMAGAPADTTPPVVTTLTATPASPTQVNINFQATDASGIGGYDLDFSLNGTTNWVSLLNNSPLTNFSHTQRTPGTQYFYRVRARDTVSPTPNVSGYSTTTTTTPASGGTPVASYPNEFLRQISCGRMSGGTINGVEQDTDFVVGSAASAFGNVTLNLTGVNHPVSEDEYKTYRAPFGSNYPEYILAGFVPGQTYRILFSAHEMDPAMANGQRGGINLANDGFVGFEGFDPYTLAGGVLNKVVEAQFFAKADAGGVLKPQAVWNGFTTGGFPFVTLLRIAHAPPQADFSFTPISGNQPRNTTFTDASVGTTPDSWFWEFGDGTTSAQQNPAKSFAVAGKYKVKLTVTNRFGSTSVTKTVTVSSATVLTLPDSLPNAVNGSNYPNPLSASGGTGPYTFSLVNDEYDHDIDYNGNRKYNRKYALPNGLTVTAAGILGIVQIPNAVQVIFEGDSNTAPYWKTNDFEFAGPPWDGYIGGSEADDRLLRGGGNYSDMLARELPKSWKFWNVATGGETPTQMDDQFELQILPKYDAAFKKNIVVLAAGINQISGMAYLQDLKDQYISWVGKAKAAGFTIIVTTIQAGNVINTQDLLDEWNAFNAWLMDPATLPEIDLKINWADYPGLAAVHPYYYKDGVHFTEKGRRKRADIIKAAILQLTSTGTGTANADYHFNLKVEDSLGNALIKEYTLTVTNPQALDYQESDTTPPSTVTNLTVDAARNLNSDSATDNVAVSHYITQRRTNGGNWVTLTPQTKAFQDNENLPSSLGTYLLEYRRKAVDSSGNQSADWSNVPGIQYTVNQPGTGELAVFDFDIDYPLDYEFGKKVRIHIPRSGAKNRQTRTEIGKKWKLEVKSEYFDPAERAAIIAFWDEHFPDKNFLFHDKDSDELFEAWISSTIKAPKKRRGGGEFSFVIEQV